MYTIYRNDFEAQKSRKIVGKFGKWFLRLAA